MSPFAPDLIEGCLVLSTAHMPETEPEFGGLRSVEFRYGYVVWSTDAEQAAEEGGVPEWLVPINESADRLGATLILFDRDAEKCNDFREYEW